VDEAVDVERIEHDYDAAEVGPLDFGDGGVVELVEKGPLSVQPKALPRRDG
tara:strand:- start:633 stop:785 length:153 start_codon:yes stop_codon:yes gene_type:complete